MWQCRGKLRQGAEAKKNTKGKKMSTQETITRLQYLVRELGIQATTVREAPAGKIVIDWNGDEETFATVEEAEKALRKAAE